jgi:hypothetical protein
MKRKRGRPQRLLARMKGEDRTEIRAAFKYGTRAWRFLLLRELLRGKKGLPENCFSMLRAQHDCDEHERDAIFRKYQTWKARLRALRKMRELRITPILHLWSAFVHQFERALICRDDDWLQELAKAIRGEVSQHHRAQFTVKVIDLLDYVGSPDVTASEIYDLLHKEKVPVGKIEGLRVEGHIFQNRDRVIDAIHDIAAEIGFTLARRNQQLTHSSRR